MSATSAGLTRLRRGRARRVAAVLLAAVTVALIALLPLPSSARAEGAPVSVSALSPEEVKTLLVGVPLPSLPAMQLSEVVSERLSASPSPALESTLRSAIAGLASHGGTLDELAGSSQLASELERSLDELPLLERLGLEGLLGLGGVNTLAGVLKEALGSLEPSEIVATLLRRANEAEGPAAPARLIEEVLAAPNLQTLERLIGSTLSGEPFNTGTVEELASHEGTSSQQLAEDFDTTGSQVAGTAMALTAPLSSGETLAVLDGLKGIDVGTLAGELPGGSETPGGSGGSGGGSGGGTGGDGGAGGPGSGSGPGSTTVVNELLVPGAAPMGKAATASAGKVKVISRKARGDTITLVVQAPAAGSLRVAGKGIRTARKKARKAERVTLRTVLKKATAGSLHKRHRPLHIVLDVTFKPVTGAGSAAATRVTVG